MELDACRYVLRRAHAVASEEELMWNIASDSPSFTGRDADTGARSLRLTGLPSGGETAESRLPAARRTCACLSHSALRAGIRIILKANLAFEPLKGLQSGLDALEMRRSCVCGALSFNSV
ncbi:hypothetical protein AAFF_G00106140 [Aldrovandia affinis]|uniref:Uncharacterized protein n=1 Tax=Aldrovandia affinis TaxID=143900 RepID=A0AAD7T3B8_9TELE|nr:hypothetical protein AAFF_G00106140 [Aldrovandia affinis]